RRGIAEQTLAANEVVAGEVDALEPESRAAPDVHVDDRQRDGHAGASGEDVVQEAVARVVVVGEVAREPLLVEEVLAKRLKVRQEVAPRRLPLHTRARRVGELLEARQRRPDVERRVLERRQQQRGFGEVVLAGAARQLQKAIACGHASRLAGSGRATSDSSSGSVMASIPSTASSALGRRSAE